MGCAGSSQKKTEEAPAKKLRKPKAWKHPQPITMAELRQLRDEFWDTAPHYGGQKGTFCMRLTLVQALHEVDLNFGARTKMITSREVNLQQQPPPPLFQNLRVSCMSRYFPFSCVKGHFLSNISKCTNKDLLGNKKERRKKKEM